MRSDTIITQSSDEEEKKRNNNNNNNNCEKTRRLQRVEILYLCSVQLHSRDWRRHTELSTQCLLLAAAHRTTESVNTREERMRVKKSVTLNTPIHSRSLITWSPYEIHTSWRERQIRSVVCRTVYTIFCGKCFCSANAEREEERTRERGALIHNGRWCMAYIYIVRFCVRSYVIRMVYVDTISLCPQYRSFSLTLLAINSPNVHSLTRNHMIVFPIFLFELACRARTGPLLVEQRSWHRGYYKVIMKVFKIF